LARITVRAVPEISRFHGIVIFMFHTEGRHMGRPHFHAVHAENDISIDIETMGILIGRMPRRQLRLVTRWLAFIETSFARTGFVRAGGRR
jgi:hypothetical protein